jgi:hypothetical protein
MNNWEQDDNLLMEESFEPQGAQTRTCEAIQIMETGAIQKSRLCPRAYPANPEQHNILLPEGPIFLALS